MTTTDLGRFSKMLDEKESELAARLRTRDGIAVERMADELDTIQMSGLRELAIDALHRESELLRAIRDARARIADGSFGVCVDCEEEISKRRIDVLPWAARCVRCQEQHDAEQARRAAEGSFSLEAAA